MVVHIVPQVLFIKEILCLMFIIFASKLLSLQRYKKGSSSSFWKKTKKIIKTLKSLSSAILCNDVIARSLNLSFQTHSSDHCFIFHPIIWDRCFIFHQLIWQTLSLLAWLKSKCKWNFEKKEFELGHLAICIFVWTP